MSGQSWGKAVNHNDGFKAEKEGSGTLYSGGVDSQGYISRENHIHFHNDGVTVTHDGNKTTVYSDRERNSSDGNNSAESSSESSPYTGEY